MVYGIAQFCLYVAGSIPRVTSAIHERLTLRRRKHIDAAHAFQKQVDKVKTHPVAFLSGALVVVAVCALLSLYTIGTTAAYDGNDLGTVSGIRTVNAVVDDLENITRETLGDESYTVDMDKLDTQVGVVRRQSVESREEFTDNLSDELGMVEYAYALYIDGEPVAATTFPGALDELLDQLKKGYITANTVDSYFVENVEIKQEYVDASLVMNLGNIAEILNATKAGEVTYTVQAGDSYYYIAELYGMSVDDLLDMNPGYDPKLLRVGDVLTISNAVPYLTIVNVERQNYVQDIPYEVEYQDDNTMYQGDYKVLSAGTFGKADVTANVTYINGEETARQVVASVTLSDPVTETQARGTIPPGSPPAASAGPATAPSPLTSDAATPASRAPAPITRPSTSPTATVRRSMPPTAAPLPIPVGGAVMAIWSSLTMATAIRPITVIIVRWSSQRASMSIRDSRSPAWAPPVCLAATTVISVS